MSLAGQVVSWRRDLASKISVTKDHLLVHPIEGTVAHFKGLLKIL